MGGWVGRRPSFHIFLLGRGSHAPEASPKAAPKASPKGAPKASPKAEAKASPKAGGMEGKIDEGR